VGAARADCAVPARGLHLSATQTGLITAIPLLGGSLFRPIMGWSAIASAAAVPA
jgi:nitrate/nitrite transporter NarK